MTLICTHSPISKKTGKPIFALTVGKEYEGEESIDPPGILIRDDNGCKEVFFDTRQMFTEKESA